MTVGRSALARFLILVVLCITASPAAALLSPNVLRGGNAALKRISDIHAQPIEDAAPAKPAEGPSDIAIPASRSAARSFEARLVANLSLLVHEPPTRAILAQLSAVLPQTILERLEPLLGAD